MNGRAKNVYAKRCLYALSFESRTELPSANNVVQGFAWAKANGNNRRLVLWFSCTLLLYMQPAVDGRAVFKRRGRTSLLTIFLAAPAKLSLKFPDLNVTEGYLMAVILKSNFSGG